MCTELRTCERQMCSICLDRSLGHAGLVRHPVIMKLKQILGPGHVYRLPLENDVKIDSLNYDSHTRVIPLLYKPEGKPQYRAILDSSMLFSSTIFLVSFFLFAPTKPLLPRSISTSSCASQLVSPDPTRPSPCYRSFPTTTHYVNPVLPSIIHLSHCNVPFKEHPLEILTHRLRLVGGTFMPRLEDAREGEGAMLASSPGSVSGVGSSLFPEESVADAGKVRGSACLGPKKGGNSERGRA